MFRAARERRRILVKEKSLDGSAPDGLDQNDTIDSGGVKIVSASASLPFVSEAAPPDNAGSSSRSTSPPVQQQQQHQADSIFDRIELAQINENLSEQLEWQQQQQRHQAQMDHSQAGYGLSGTGAYC
ncbi:hypothetical protein BGX21_002417 [Mortierella sp. AD011]|nr:hypothetical protein BGX20_009856 [Mortierella sp. AD010]KAF9380242.1 hypothetical protein BGX21_002417 [Mortierella sp. AD011]